jgi:polygalacturonase
MKPTSFLDVALKAGDVLKIQKGNGDALEYGVDFVEIEPVPTAKAALANSLSVTDYGANGSDQADDLAAFDACIAAAKAQGKNVYIPSGKFYISAKLN